MSEKYKVVWTDPKGNDHEGSPTSQEIAQAWVDYENQKYPQLRHLIVRVLSEENSDTPEK